MKHCTWFFLHPNKEGVEIHNGYELNPNLNSVFYFPASPLSQPVGVFPHYLVHMQRFCGPIVCLTMDELHTTLYSLSGHITPPPLLLPLLLVLLCQCQCLLLGFSALN